VLVEVIMEEGIVVPKATRLLARRERGRFTVVVCPSNVKSTFLVFWVFQHGIMENELGNRTEAQYGISDGHTETLGLALQAESQLLADSNSMHEVTKCKVSAFPHPTNLFVSFHRHVAAAPTQ